MFEAFNLHILIPQYGFRCKRIVNLDLDLLDIFKIQPFLVPCCESIDSCPTLVDGFRPIHAGSND